MQEFFISNNYIFLASFGILSFISIVASNVAMVLSVIVLLACFIAPKKTVTERVHELWKNSPLKYILQGIIMFLLATLLSAIFSDNPVSSLKSWLNNWPWRCLMFIVPVLTIEKEKQAKKVLYAMFAGLFLACCYMIYQSIILHEPRPNGFYGHWMMNAGLLCELLPVMVICILYKNMVSIPISVLGISTLVVIGGLIANATRGAWLACTITILILIGLQLKKRTKQALVLVLCCTLIGVGLSNNQNIVDRVYSMINMTTDGSNTSRLEMWQSAIAMYNDNPVLGVGERQYFTKTMEQYRSAKMSVLFSHPHSIFFHVLCVNGSIGIISLFVMFGSILYNSFKYYLRWDNPWYLAMFSSTVCLLLQGATEYNIGHATIAKIYWLLMGILFVLAYAYDNRNQEEKNE